MRSPSSSVSSSPERALSAARGPARRRWPFVLGQAVLLAATFALFGLYFLRPEYDIDIFWHVKAGEWIVQHRAFPTTDVFNYEHPERAWVTFQWLYQVAAYGLHSVGGFGALRAANVALLTLGFLMVWRLAYVLLDRRWWLAWMVLALFSALYHDRIRLRPHVLSLVLEMLVAVPILQRFQRSSWRTTAWMVAVALVWGNAHAGAVNVLIVMLGALVSGSLADRWALGAGDVPVRRLLVTCGAIGLVLALSPNFIRGNWTAFTMFEATKLIIPEWKPTYSYLELGDAPHFLLCGLAPYVLVLPIAVQGSMRLLGLEARRAWMPLGAVLALILLKLGTAPGAAPAFLVPLFTWGFRLGVAATLLYLFMHQRRPGVLAEMLIALALLLVAHTSARFAYLAILPFVILVRWNLPALVRHAPSMGTLAVLVGLCSLGISAHYYFRVQRQGVDDALDKLSYELEPTRFPEQATDFLVQAGLGGRILNQTEWGGYLLYRLYPQAQVFCDGRGNLDAEELVAVIETHKPYDRDATLEVTARRFGFDLAVFKAPMFPRGWWDSTRWRRIYHDPEVDVVLRLDHGASPQLAKVEAWYALRGIPAPAPGDARAIRAWERQVAGHWWQAWKERRFNAARLADFERRATSASRLGARLSARVGLARFAIEADQPDEGSQRVDRVLREAPFHARALLWGAFARHLQGRFDEVAGPVQMALLLDGMPLYRLLGRQWRLKVTERVLADYLLKWPKAPLNPPVPDVPFREPAAAPAL